jgi:hypothetical protein
MTSGIHRPGPRINTPKDEQKTAKTKNTSLKRKRMESGRSFAMFQLVFFFAPTPFESPVSLTADIARL